DGAADDLAVVAAPTPAIEDRSGDAIVVESTPVPTQISVPAVNASALRITALDKGEEWAEIRNDGSTAQDLGGWVLRSERGTQDCPLGGVIQPGETLRIWAMNGVGGFSCGFGSNIWNNREYDPAVLLAPGGEEVSRLD
ncbi:MAG: lamin tail domain-containing protein, partial [Caldilinea sp.]|nr:lamin tail domain-containing protein [Caldilinea sp.]